MLLLLGGAVVSASVGHILDAVAIGVIVGINAVVGFAQEYRAENAVVALRQLTAPRAVVVRDGMPTVVPAATVVVGDVLVLEPGDVVAADARVCAAHNLTVNEAVLTGESLPVAKAVDGAGVDGDERAGEVFLGTNVATGTGRAEVTATARATEMGRIAAALAQQPTNRTPLQERLESLGRSLVVVCLVLVAMVAVIALARGMGWVEVLLTSVSLAVAALPEGLPAVVTIALAVGVRRMSRRDVLVRRLAAVETLGSATVICTDKTGTLTTGVMEVREVWGERAAVLRAAASASSAVLDHTGGGTGDPTELALLRAAREAGIESSALEADNPTVDVEPFDVTTRMMTVRRRDGTVDRKGAFEAVLPSCGPCPDGAHEAHDAHDAHDTMTARGLRVLAVASGRDDGLTLLGLVGFADPPRPEALAAIAQAKRAGIRVVMITGDHPRTANAIAEEMGVGEVFARKTATDKLAIVQQLRARGEVVAMTGDGVNDAPSIKEADIGVAMGKSATEATRQAADMILTEDNLSGIVHAIREGRVIFGNLRKTVVYLLGGNAAELMFVTLATAMGLPMPLLPLQLLWINLLSEPLPGIALAIDRPETDVLDHPPRPRTEPLLGRRQWIEIAVVAALQAALVLAAYAWALQRHDVPTARTFAFSVLVFGVVVRALAGRSATRIYWEAPLGNPRLIAVVAIAVALQIGVVYLGPAQRLFGTTALTYADMGLAFGLGLVPVTLVELSKLARRWRAHAHRP